MRDRRAREEGTPARGKSTIVPFCALSEFEPLTFSRVPGFPNSVSQLSDKFPRGFFNYLN